MRGKCGPLAGLFLALIAAPAWANGQLAIESVPSGAKVLLDGQYAGVTPLVVEAPEGRYGVRVQAKGREEKGLVVRVKDGLTTRRVVRLEAEAPATGELRAFTKPAGAQLYLDGRAIGGSPAYLRGLAPGRYRVAAVRGGHRTVGRTITVRPGLTTSVALSLPVLPPPPTLAPAPARPVVRAPEPAPKAIAERPAVVAPAPKRQPTRRHVPVAAPTPMPVVTPVPEAPGSAPAPVWPDLRAWLFWGLMLLVLAALGRHLAAGWKRGREAIQQWYPARPGHWLMPWHGSGSPDEASVGAIAQMSLGRWTEGADLLWHVLDRQPGTAWHYYHLGLALQRAGRAWEAETAYRTAIQLEPDWDAPHMNLALLLEATHQPAEAVITYRRLLLAVPKHGDAHYNLGHVYFELKMWNQAIAQWEAARKLAPRDVDVKQNLRFARRVAKAERRRSAPVLRRAA